MGCGVGKGRCVGGVGSVLGCAKVWGGVGNGGRCVEVSLGCGEMCLGCGERCGKGVGVGSMWGVRGSVGRNLGERENMGRRVVSRFWTPTLLTLTLQPQPP